MKKVTAVICVFLLIVSCIVPGRSTTTAEAGIIDSEGNVNISKISGASKTSWNGVSCTAYGYSGVYGLYFGDNAVFYLGNVDFSLYTEVVFTYSSDAANYGKYNGSGESSAITMKSVSTQHPGSSANCAMNTTGLIAKADLSASIITNSSGSNWDKAERTARADLTDNDYNGPVYLQHYIPQDQGQILVTGIKFVKKTQILRGDINSDWQVDTEDCLKLAKALLIPDLYELNQDMDVNGDGKETSADAVYLLKHTVSSANYPLSGTAGVSYKNKISRDQLMYNGATVNGKIGYTLESSVLLSKYVGKTVYAFGWYASTSPIVKFGYSVDYQSITWTTSEKITPGGEDNTAIAAAAAAALGSDRPYYNRFKIYFPVTKGDHIVEFFVDDGECRRIWTINYSTTDAAERLLAAAKEVADFVRTNGFTYGDATINPGVNWAGLSVATAINSNERLVSCDRLVCWALYRAGYTNQPYSHGLCLTSGSPTLQTWCANQGFKKIENWADLQPGDIVFVKSVNGNYPGHTYIHAGWYSSVGGDVNYRYDGGSTWRIQQVQPYAQSVSVAGETFMYAYRPV